MNILYTASILFNRKKNNKRKLAEGERSKTLVFLFLKYFHRIFK